MCATATLSIGLYAGPLMLLADRRTLYVHAMDLADGPDALRADVRDTLEGPPPARRGARRLHRRFKPVVKPWAKAHVKDSPCNTVSARPGGVAEPG